MKQSFLSFILASMCLLPIPAFAADALPPAPFSPLEIVSPKGLFIMGANIKVEGKDATITLDVKNKRSHQIISTLRFTLPRLTWEGESNDYFDRDFPELGIEVNHQKVTPAKMIDAYAGKKRITNQLTTYHLDPMTVASADLPANLTQGIDAEQVTKLIRQHVFHQVEGTIYQNWALGIRYQWRQQFRANAVTQIVYHYRLRPGFSIWNANPEDSGGEDLEKLMKRYCSNHQILEKELQDKGQHSEYYLHNEFMLPIANLAPGTIHFQYTPQQENSSWLPLVTASCYAKEKTASPSELLLDVNNNKYKALHFLLVQYQP